MDEQPAAPQIDPKALGEKWMQRIRDAEKREERWIKDAQAAEKAYACGADEAVEGKVYEFNILHSNVETIVPAIFNSSPIPDIRERFKTGDTDPMSALSRLVAEVYDRALRIQIDDGRLEQEVERVAQDAFLAGRGILRIRFDADVTEQPPIVGMDPMTGEPVEQEQPPRVENERLTFEAVSWRDFRMGPAMRWSDVPWVAFRQCVTEEEVERITDPALRDMLAKGRDPASKPVLAQAESEDVYLWEIWCRESRTVKFMVEHSSEIIAEQPDPMGLPDFYPMCAPIQPISLTGKIVPVCPFSVYRKLADELEDITRRIRKIVAACKVKALAAVASEDIEAWAQAEDNTITPAANSEALAQTGGMDKGIAWWPVESATVVLRELYAAREATKAMIYEITGISDIVRGDSNAGETATAQQIKTQWGSLRIRKMQRQIERLVRDAFVISAEIISQQFSPETLQKMTGVMLPPEAMQMLSAPLDHYRIDVESDSTVRADMQGKRQEMGEFLNGTASYFQTMGPLVAQAPMMAGPIIDLYAAFARQFSLGKQAEDALEALAAFGQQAAQAAQQPPQPDPNAEREQQIRGRELDVKELQAVTALEREKVKAMQPQVIQGGMNG